MPTTSTLYGRTLAFAVIGLAAIVLASTMAFGQSNTSSTNISNLSTSELCTLLEDRLNGMAIQNGNVCDIILARTSPNIVGTNGMSLNKFTLMNSVLEFTKPATSSNSLYVMGDFALLENELNPVLDIITDYGWTVTGIHNHMIMESPKLMMVHFETMDSFDNLIREINTALESTGIPHGSATTTPPTTPTTGTTTPGIPNTGRGTTTATSTPTTGTITPTTGTTTPGVPNTGSGATTATSTNSITLMLTRHLCPPDIDSRTDLNGQNPETVCPPFTVNDQLSSGNTALEDVFLVTARDNSTGVTGLFANRPSFVSGTGCTISATSTGWTTPGAWWNWWWTMGSSTHATSTATSTASWNWFDWWNWWNASSTVGTTTAATTTPLMNWNNCADAATFVWQNIPRSDVTITQSYLEPRYGFATLDSNDQSALISEGGSVINLNTRNDADGMIKVHLFDFQ